MYYFTSDTHFGHANIIKYCNRPFMDADRMDSQLITNWLQIVKPFDVVYHLGDFAFTKDFEDYYIRLTGRIIHIKGNHDKSKHSNLQRATIHLGGRDWLLVHNPENAMHTNHKYILCGHVHEKQKIWEVGEKLFVNVGVDVWDFKPVTMKQILEAVEEYYAEQERRDGD